MFRHSNFRSRSDKSWSRVVGFGLGRVEADSNNRLWSRYGRVGQGWDDIALLVLVVFRDVQVRSKWVK